MHLTRRNVNEVFHDLVGLIHNEQIDVVTARSRVGDVLTVREPLVITYRHPRERVLMNPVRDCNPFFHLYEALWMLAGRNDVASLQQFTSKMAQYSDDGQTLHGAYGYRWRYHPDGKPYDDQLSIIIKLLRQDLTTRRLVLTMWSPTRDLAWQDTNGALKDLPCNTHAYFKVCGSQLDLTVCNRSNDLVLGLTGANAVHFSLLQEYVANRCGLGVGQYHQFSNNVHAYLSNWRPTEWLAATPATNRWYDDHPEGRSATLMATLPSFDRECGLIVRYPFANREYEDPFLQRTALPMFHAFILHRQREYEAALERMNLVQCADWRWAGMQWILRRRERWERRREQLQASTD